MTKVAFWPGTNSLRMKGPAPIGFKAKSWPHFSTSALGTMKLLGKARTDRKFAPEVGRLRDKIEAARRAIDSLVTQINTHFPAGGGEE